MSGIAEWRPIEGSAAGGQPAEADGAAVPAEHKPAGGAWRVAALILLAGLGTGAAALALWAGTPQPQLVLATQAGPSATESAGPTAAAAAGQLVIDVEGAVALPGLYVLEAGSRVGDAIDAAGGYAPNVDIEAAARTLNLAAPLADGEKVLVPRLGQQQVGAEPSTGAGPGAQPTTGGLIDINTADAAALDTLPGVGPVTAAKIIAARDEAPFTSVDELLSRGVLGSATFEKVRPLVTVGP
jgi:competence protein ComEA